LGTSFGRGGATTFQQDLQNADCIVIEGSNMAECHPVGFGWVMEAKARGATLIHVDPRFTRTSAMADIHVPIRAGADIAFLGGLVNHVLSGGHEFREYVAAYTNASTILREDFRDTEDLDGLFSGWDAEHAEYDPASWMYEGAEIGAAAGQRDQQYEDRVGSGVGQAAHGESHGSGGAAVGGAPERDPTLTHPRCVFQVLKRHFARYTPELVHAVCGIPPDLFRRVAEAVVSNSGRTHDGVRLLGRVDPAHRGRAIHPHRGHPADAAGQHRPPGRGDPRAPGARVDSRVDRHPDALQSAARIHPDAACAPARDAG
jgi:formate dehydrogenase major subunit